MKDESNRRSMSAKTESALASNIEGYDHRNHEPTTITDMEDGTTWPSISAKV